MISADFPDHSVEKYCKIYPFPVWLWCTSNYQNENHTLCSTRLSHRTAMSPSCRNPRPCVSVFSCTLVSTVTMKQKFPSPRLSCSYSLLYIRGLVWSVQPLLSSPAAFILSSLCLLCIFCDALGVRLFTVLIFRFLFVIMWWAVNVSRRAAQGKLNPQLCQRSCFAKSAFIFLGFFSGVCHFDGLQAALAT